MDIFRCLWYKWLITYSLNLPLQSLQLHCKVDWSWALSHHRYCYQILFSKCLSNIVTKYFLSNMVNQISFIKYGDQILLSNVVIRYCYHDGNLLAASLMAVNMLDSSLPRPTPATSKLGWSRLFVLRWTMNIIICISIHDNYQHYDDDDDDGKEDIDWPTLPAGLVGPLWASLVWWWLLIWIFGIMMIMMIKLIIINHRDTNNQNQ